MITAELRRATREFDREFVADTFLPLDVKAKKLDAEARRRRGRPIRMDEKGKLKWRVERVTRTT